MDEENESFQSWQLELGKAEENSRAARLAIADLVLATGSLEDRLLWDFSVSNRLPRRWHQFDQSEVPKFLGERLKKYKVRVANHFKNEKLDGTFERVQQNLLNLLSVRNAIAHHRVQITDEGDINVTIHRTKFPKAGAAGLEWQRVDLRRDLFITKDEIVAITAEIKATDRWFNSLHIEFTEDEPNGESHFLDMYQAQWPTGFRSSPYPWDWDAEPEKVARFVCKAPAQP